MADAKKRVTMGEFLERSKIAHGEKYDYSKVEYKSTTEKVLIVCLTCGDEFTQKPSFHMMGFGCLKCSFKIGRKRLTQEQFVQRSTEVHGTKFDYSKAVYVTGKDKVVLICKACGTEFSQEASSHLCGHGCPQCRIVIGRAKRTKPFEQFVADARGIHGEKYTYDGSDFVNRKSEISITCNQCGTTFKQNAHGHLAGYGCTTCSYASRSAKMSYDTESFIAKATSIHGDRYDYSQVKYIKSSQKVSIRCKACGEHFGQVASYHVAGNGCPRCKSSSGEVAIGRILDAIGIEYETEKSFRGCKNKRSLLFDFYLARHKTCIEYQGSQHYIANAFFGGEEALRKTKQRDQTKREYCEKHSMRLIEIPYTWSYDEIVSCLCGSLNNGQAPLLLPNNTLKRQGRHAV